MLLSFEIMVQENISNILYYFVIVVAALAVRRNESVSDRFSYFIIYGSAGSLTMFFPYC